MSKCSVKIGYANTQETRPGVWEEITTEKPYRGDVIRLSKSNPENSNLNDDLKVNNEISIVADPFAYQNFHTMRYVRWMGTAWKITKVDVQRPRLILSIGGVYNE